MSKIVRMKTTEVNTEIAERIRSERERLALTQAAMAEKAGVSRATQVNYETAKRMPDLDYLRAVGKLGVDVPYLLTGIPTSADTIERRALLKTLTAICDRLEIHYMGILEAAYEEVQKEAGKPGPSDDDEGALTLIDEVEAAIFDAINRVELDGTLLEDVLLEIEQEGADAAPLSPRKKAQLAVMLYRAFKPTGKVDPEVVRQGVALLSN